MASNVVELHRRPSQIAHVLSMGHSHHRIIEDLVARNAFPFARVLVDASHVRAQHELIRALKAKGIQVVLDPKSIEISLPGGVTGPTCSLPWALNEDKALPLHALSDRNVLQKYAREVANFAIAMGVDVVLSPSHYLGPNLNNELALSIDAATCETLRGYLDAAGGNSIAIDYLLCGNLTHLQKSDLRPQLSARLSRLPVGSVWLRADGFGHGATCAAIRKEADLCFELTSRGTPVVIDRVSGVTAMLLAAIGAAGGISHGISNNRERFNSYHLRNPPVNGNGSRGGPPRWIYLPTLDIHLKSNQFEALAEVKGAKSRILCTDSCCPSGLHSTIENYIPHAITQRAQEIRRLNSVPDANRQQWLLTDEIDSKGRSCRRLGKVIADANIPDVQNKLNDQSKRMDDLHELLDQMLNDYGRSRAPSVPSLHRSHIMPEVSGY